MSVCSCGRPSGHVPVVDCAVVAPWAGAVHDRMFGEGEWVVHEGCPDAAIAGQDRAVHHRSFHA